MFSPDKIAKKEILFTNYYFFGVLGHREISLEMTGIRNYIVTKVAKSN